MTVALQYTLKWGIPLITFSISVVLNCFCFCLSLKVFIFLSNLNDSLGSSGILEYRFFPIITLNTSGHATLSSTQSFCQKKSTLCFVGVPCRWSVAFPLLFLTFSLTQIFVILNIMSCCGLLWVLLGWDSVSRIWMSVSFPWLGKFAAIIFSNKLSALSFIFCCMHV